MALLLRSTVVDGGIIIVEAPEMSATEAGRVGLAPRLAVLARNIFY